VPGAEILVVEDDQRIGSSLARALQGQGYAVKWARTGAAALELLDPTTAFVILDLGLPDVDGVDLCRTLRAQSPGVQVLILTARSEEVDVVVGLDAGADDYIVKPFGLAELLARIRVCERRRPDTACVTIGDLEIDVGERRVTVRGEPVELSVKEYELVLMLGRNAGEIVRRSHLIESIWDEQSIGSTKTIDTHVWSLRRKLDAADRPSRITTIRGVGYRMERQ
jgi:DNA-binding response OmpR family regulator